MRIGYVSQWFPPEPAHIALQIAEGLQERGHEVTVVTGFPNYPQGQLYAGYRQRFGLPETVRGLEVHRAPLITSHGTSVIGRFANYCSFAASASLAARKVVNPDVWLTYSSPALAGIPALVNGIRRAPRALILQDLWPDSITESSLLPAHLQRVVNATVGPVSRATYRDAAAIGVISPGMRAVLTDRGVHPDRIHYTPNWVDAAPETAACDDAAALRRALQIPEHRRIFMYAGNLGDFQALDLLIRGFDGVQGAHLVLIGSGSSEKALRSLASSMSMLNVQFVERQSQESLRRYITASDVQVVSLADRPLMGVTMPSKVQASLATGKPVLAHAVGDVASLIRRADAGLAATPGSADLGAALQSFVAMSDAELRRLGRNARSVFESEFSREVGITRVEQMLVAAVRSSTGK
ncbi:glycosyltransferase family 4 protein [Terrabacter sp. NPDC080008]|uniref:glycosyltransferase family 4 protein n=1 Tax=Terrabacter sp. NPDC080008 TaxID=3155176 RepID=UPI00344F2921